jgi:hypothetical protein
VGQCLANPDIHVHQSLADILAPPPPVDYEKWATENVSFSDRESQFTGPYNASRFRPFTEIYKALSPSDPCRIVTLSKGAQIGGTIIATVFTLGSLDLDPSDFLYVHPTEENARRWSRLKLSPQRAPPGDFPREVPRRRRLGDVQGARGLPRLHLKANSVVNWFVALFLELGYEGCSSHSGRRSFTWGRALRLEFNS